MKLVDRFARVTSSGRFIPEIDGLRFIAIFGVILYHAAPTGFFFRYGWAGVQLFFAISGFILGLPFASQHLLGAKPVNLAKYFRRRLTRLEPPYILSILATFAFGLLVSHKLTWGENGKHLLASLVYMHNLVFGHESYISTVAWSLEIEVQFYCLVPLLALLFAIPQRRHRRGAMVLVMLALATAQAFLPPGFMRFKLSLANQLQYFLAGFLLADVFLVDWKQRPGHSYRWDVVGLLALALLYAACPSRVVFNFAFPFATLLLYAAVFRSRVFNAVFRSPATTLFGGMCYTVYLFHSQIMDVTRRALPRLDALSLFPVQMALICVCCGVFFLLVEKPCMKPDWPIELYGRVKGLFGSPLRAGDAESPEGR